MAIACSKANIWIVQAVNNSYNKRESHLGRKV